MADESIPFTDEELTTADTVPLTADILYHALRIGTQALSEFGHLVMEPVFRSQLELTDRETAIGMTFYRLLAAVHTLSDLRRPYQFQAISGQTRLIFELCVDIHLLAKKKIINDVEKFHGFTRAARFSAAYKTIEFYKLHPELEDPGDAEERRALVETPGKKDEIEALCERLWNTHKAPEHWSGLRWSEQLKLLEPEIHEWYVQWSSLHAWFIHGGGAGVGGLPPQAFQAVEVICREKVKSIVPEAYRLVAVEMHMHRALPNFFDELDRVKNKVALYAAVDAKLQSIGRPSKLEARGNASDRGEG
jgi:hypothetical protein